MGAAVESSRGLKRKLEVAARVAPDGEPSLEAAAGAGGCDYCTESKEDECVFDASQTEADGVPMRVDTLHFKLSVLNHSIAELFAHERVYGGRASPAAQALTGDTVHRLLRG